MEMSRRFFDELVTKADEYDDIEFTDSYSGRFMFGRLCFGFVGSTGAVDEFYNILRDIMLDEGISESVREEAEHFFTDRRKDIAQDNMGLKFIFYFPYVSVEEPVEETISDEV